jgi:hypothetical protein
MRTRRLLERAMDLILKARSTRDIRTKDKALDGLWEIMINIEFNLKNREWVSAN